MRFTLSVLIVALLIVGCDSDTVEETTTTTVTTTTIGVAITSAGPAAVTVGEGVDGQRAARLEAELDDLRTTTEALRGLGFLDPPRVAIVNDGEFSARREAITEAELDLRALAGETRLMQTLGLLDPAQDLEAMLGEVAAEPVPVFYDAVAEELVIAVSSEPLEPHGRSLVVRELVRALTDVYHRHAARSGELAAAGRHDEAVALSALASADATYFQLVYIQGLPEEERAAASVSPVTATDLPRYLVAELSFPYEAGILFIEALLDQGGIAALDGAYGTEALTTQHLRHPMRHLAGERTREVPPIEVSVPGYTLESSGSLGELGLTSLLIEALPPGMLTQTGDGWGGDAFAVFADGEDVAFVYTYRGDTIDDAFEVAQGFLDHARDVMGMAEPQEAGGGVEFVGRAGSEDEEAAGPYVFVDRDGEGLVFVVSDQPATGRLLRDAVDQP